jgi:hypothetical protein
LGHNQALYQLSYTHPKKYLNSKIQFRAQDKCCCRLTQFQICPYGWEVTGKAAGAAAGDDPACRAPPPSPVVTFKSQRFS